MKQKEEMYRYFNDMNEWDALPEGWQQFQTVCCPEVVKCHKCGTEFNAIDERDADEDE